MKLLKLIFFLRLVKQKKITNEISKQINKYLDKIPKAANVPNNNQSIILLFLNPLQKYKADKAQKGS